jgi:hypothetical protein
MKPINRLPKHQTIDNEGNLPPIPIRPHTSLPARDNWAYPPARRSLVYAEVPYHPVHPGYELIPYESVSQQDEG